jgi:hypothetical protein
MAAKQFNETDKQQRGKGKQQEANLGQKEAREQKEKKSELSVWAKVPANPATTLTKSETSGWVPHGWRT